MPVARVSIAIALENLTCGMGMEPCRVFSLMLRRLVMGAGTQENILPSGKMWATFVRLSIPTLGSPRNLMVHSTVVATSIFWNRIIVLVSQQHIVLDEIDWITTIRVEFDNFWSPSILFLLFFRFSMKGPFASHEWIIETPQQNLILRHQREIAGKPWKPIGIVGICPHLNVGGHFISDTRPLIRSKGDASSGNVGISGYLGGLQGRTGCFSNECGWNFYPLTPVCAVKIIRIPKSGEFFQLGCHHIDEVVLFVIIVYTQIAINFFYRFCGWLIDLGCKVFRCILSGKILFVPRQFSEKIAAGKRISQIGFDCQNESNPTIEVLPRYSIHSFWFHSFPINGDLLPCDGSFVRSPCRCLMYFLRFFSWLISLSVAPAINYSWIPPTILFDFFDQKFKLLTYERRKQIPRLKWLWPIA